MTNKELQAELKKYPPEMKLAVSEEGSYYPLTDVNEIMLEKQEACVELTFSDDGELYLLIQ